MIKPKTVDERRQRNLGRWDALNFVLNYLNTLEDKIIDKTKIYKYVHDIRPDDMDWDEYLEDEE